MMERDGRWCRRTRWRTIGGAGDRAVPAGRNGQAPTVASTGCSGEPDPGRAGLHPSRQVRSVASGAASRCFVAGHQLLNGPPLNAVQSADLL